MADPASRVRLWKTSHRIRMIAQTENRAAIDQDENGVGRPMNPQQSMIFDRQDVFDRLGEDEELVHEVLDIYLEDAPNQIERVHEALKKNDLMGVSRHAHGLKGASSNVGAAEMQQLALQIELAGTRQEGGLAAALATRLETCLTRLKQELASQGFVQPG